MALWYQGKSCLCRRQNVKTWPCGSQANHIYIVDQTLDGGFVAKASSLMAKPSSCVPQRPSPYQECLMFGQQQGATHSFTRDWGLLTRKAGKSIKVQFAKSKPHEVKEVVLHMTF